MKLGALAMNEWAKVVTNPLGLAGFALFLIFGLIAKVKRSDEKRWITRVAACMAIAALAGGVAIACIQAFRPTPSAAISNSPAPGAKQTCEATDQKSLGAGSPNVNCVQGNVTITVDQNTGDSGVKNSPRKK